MLEEIIREIEGMEYPPEEVCSGPEDEGALEWYAAAAYGFAVAKMRIMDVIRNHTGDGWIPCSERMPANEQEVEITYMRESYPGGKIHYGTARAFYTDGTTTTEDSGYDWEYMDNLEYCEEKDAAYIPEGWWECVAFGETFSQVDQKVIAWRRCAKPYRLQKSVGEDCKRQIMEKFLKVE